MKRTTNRPAPDRPAPDRNGRRVLLCVPALLLAPASALLAAPDAADPFDIFISDRYLYDDNLFRVPDGLLESDPTLPRPDSLDDYVNRASIGARVRLDASRQVFHADARIDDVRYRYNDYLDYTGGNARLLWDWKVGSRWSGRILGEYDRSQASLSNYRFFQQDIVDSALYGGDIKFAIGSRWKLLAGITAAEADHSAELRRTENFESTTSRGGIEYETPAGSVFAAEYRYVDADFPYTEALVGAPRGYEESEPRLRMEYVYSVKTQVNAYVGYLDRDYRDPVAGDYSGVVWEARMLWEPRSKLLLDIEAWHKLRAYIDAESDYFVGDGISIEPTWDITTKVKLSAMYSYEKQDYTGSGISLVPLDAGREDEVQIAQVGIDYSPRDFFTLGLDYRWVDRESNREFRGYGDNVASAQVTFTF